MWRRELRKGCSTDELSERLPNLQAGRCRTSGRANAGLNDSVFFLQTAADGSVGLWVGAGDVNAHFTAVRNSRIVPDTPTSVHIAGFDAPFRVVCVRMSNGSQDLPWPVRTRSTASAREVAPSLRSSMVADRLDRLRDRFLQYPASAASHSGDHGSCFEDR